MKRHPYKERLVIEAVANLHNEGREITSDAIVDEINNKIDQDRGHRRTLTRITKYQVAPIIKRTKVARIVERKKVRRERGDMDWINIYEYTPTEQV